MKRNSGQSAAVPDMAASTCSQTPRSLQIAPISAPGSSAFDDKFAMRPEALARATDDDRRAGRVPCFVCATVGTTSSNALDPVAEIGAICKERGGWLHVDAAMSGTAALCPA